MVTASSSIKLVVNRTSPYIHLLELICKTRGLNCQVSLALHADSGVDLYDRNVLIKGFWPALEYLTARYPMPELLIGDVTTRCIMRSLVAELLASGKVDGVFFKPLSPSMWTEDFPCGQHSPNLLDLTYLAVMHDCAARQRLAEALEQFCRRARQEAA